jgi:hypothetical protein
MTHSDPESQLIILTLILLALISYFLPTIVASNWHHPDKDAIFVINLFLGWSLIGWMIALAWASQGYYYNSRLGARWKDVRLRHPH